MLTHNNEFINYLKTVILSKNQALTYSISNSNWTEWSTIQGVITRVISKLDEREADLKLRAQLLPELYDTMSNY